MKITYLPENAAAVSLCNDIFICMFIFREAFPVKRHWPFSWAKEGQRGIRRKTFGTIQGIIYNVSPISSAKMANVTMET